MSSLAKIIKKLMMVDTVDALAGLGYVAASAVTLLPDTSMSILGTSIASIALPISLAAVAVAYITNQPTFDLDDTTEQVMAVAAVSAAAIPVGVEYVSAISSAITDPVIGGALFGITFLGYGLIAGLHSDL